MLRSFFLWLEQGAYRAICTGCQRAVEDLSGGEVVIDVESAAVTDETEKTGALPKPVKRPVKKKAATRK
jgi:hypothetical protein